MNMNKAFLNDALSGRTDVNPQRKLQANAKDEHGWTALMWAEQNGHAKVADILKKKVKKEGAK